MLIRLIKYLRGYVKIRVEGYSPERFLNLCNVHRILVWGVENQGSAYELFVSVKDYKKMRPLVRKTRTRVCLLEKHGFPFFLYRFRKRKMFFGGMLLCLVCTYGLSLFIWNIHIEGNAMQSTEEILAYLETMNVRHGVQKSKVVCEDIETNLRKQYPNMLWVSAEMRGTRILVQIRENTDHDIVSKIQVKDEEPSGIISSVNGIVDSIIVRRGTPLVSKGEEVRAGQTLVEGYYEIKNDAGETIRYEGVAADADIFTMTSQTYLDRFPSVYEKKLYTGKKRIGVELSVFGKVFQIQPGIPFAHFEKKTDLYEIHVTENFYLPFSVKWIRYLEYEPEEVFYQKKSLEKLAEKRFRKKYENILQKGVQIIEKDVKIDTNGKVCRVTGKVKLLVPATEKTPVMIPEIETKVSEEGEN